MTGVKHRHLLVVCTCGTVVYDCGCQLRLLEERENACDGCRFARAEVIDRQRAVSAVGYAAQVWED